MTLADWIALGGSLLSGGGLGVVATKVVELRRAGNDRAKADDDARRDREAVLATGMAELVKTLQATAEKRTEGEDAARKAHGECLELVSGLAGRIDHLEPRLQVVEADLDACNQRHAASEARVQVLEANARTTP